MNVRNKFFSAAALCCAGLLAAQAETPASVIASSAFGEGHTYHASMNFGAELTPAISSSVSSVALPEAPSALHASYSPEVESAVMSDARHDSMAPKYASSIYPGQTAQPLSAHDKVIFGIRDSISPFSFVGIVFSAGWSHLTNGQPNYGTNSTAFAQRVGATALRDTTENLFAESLFAPMFHQDPRYYVLGDDHNLFKRALYSVTRPIITRNDSGRQTLNSSLIVGYAAASALSYTYYPEINRNFHDTAATFGGSLAGAAVGDFVSEFLGDVFDLFHHKH